MTTEQTLRDLERKIQTNEDKLNSITSKMAKLRDEKDTLVRKILNQKASLANLKAKVVKEGAKVVEQLGENLE